MSGQDSAGRRRYFMLLAALFLAICIAFAPNPSSRVLAQSFHAVLLRSNPAEGSVLAHPPVTIWLWFSEPVQLVGQSLTIFGPSGDAVAQGAVQNLNGVVSVPLRATADGTYLVSWQVISQDTDPVSGSFVFSIRHAGGAWAGTTSSGTAPLGFWLQVLAHLLHFLGYALGFGTLAFLCLIVYPLDLTRSRVLQQPLWRLVNLGILVLLLGEGVNLLAQPASLGGHSPFDLAFLALVLGSSFGRVLALRLGAALGLWILVGIAQQDHKNATTLALVLGGILALIDSTASHAISSPMVWLALIVTTLHIAAMGTWLGGLMALVTLWRDKEALAYRHALLARLSLLASASVAELVLTGIVLASLHLAHLTDLLTTSYGHVLAIKIISLLLPLLFVALSRRKPQGSQEGWWSPELLSLLGILTLAAMLVSMPSPR